MFIERPRRRIWAFGLNSSPQPFSDLVQKIDRVKRLAWIVWLVAMIAQIFNMFHRIAVPAAIDRIMGDMKITGSVAGNIMALYFYVYAVMQFPSGVLADFLGARKAVSFGCFVAALGSLLFGLAPSVSLIYVGRFLVGLGVSVIFVNVFKIGIEWFEDRKLTKSFARPAQPKSKLLLFSRQWKSI